VGLKAEGGTLSLRAVMDAARAQTGRRGISD
jgi:hypothetical protein